MMWQLKVMNWLKKFKRVKEYRHSFTVYTMYKLSENNIPCGTKVVFTVFEKWSCITLDFIVKEGKVTGGPLEISIINTYPEISVRLSKLLGAHCIFGEVKSELIK